MKVQLAGGEKCTSKYTKLQKHEHPKVQQMYTVFKHYVSDPRFVTAVLILTKRINYNSNV